MRQILEGIRSRRDPVDPTDRPPRRTLVVLRERLRRHRRRTIELTPDERPVLAAVDRFGEGLVSVSSFVGHRAPRDGVTERQHLAIARRRTRIEPAVTPVGPAFKPTVRPAI